jgi:hypothetical protein
MLPLFKEAFCVSIYTPNYIILLHKTNMYESVSTCSKHERNQKHVNIFIRKANMKVTLEKQMAQLEKEQ